MSKKLLAFPLLLLLAATACIAPQAFFGSGSDEASVEVAVSSIPIDTCHYTDEACYGAFLAAETGTTEDGIPKIGSDNAPIIVAEFGDFSCPHCANFFPDMQSLIDTYAVSGQAQFWYLPMTGLAPPYSQTSAEAAICAAEQGAFWQYHEEIFELQEIETRSAFVPETLGDLATSMGLDADALQDCMNSGLPSQAITTTQTLARQLGVTGTPQIFYSLDGGQNWQQVQASFPQIAAVIDDASSE